MAYSNAENKIREYLTDWNKNHVRGYTKNDLFFFMSGYVPEVTIKDAAEIVSKMYSEGLLED